MNYFYFRIEMSGLDGSEREVIVSDSIIWPTGITVENVKVRGKLNLKFKS